MGKEHELSVCSITQALEEKYFIGWSADELKTIALARQGILEGFMKIVSDKLAAKDIHVQEMHAIVHNQDTHKTWNESSKQDDLTPKVIHVHIAIKFQPDKGGLLRDIACAVGIEPQYVEKANRGKYAYDNMLSYLV